MNSITASIDQIREKSESTLSLRQKLIRAALALVLGGLCGFLAKYFDLVAPVIGEIGTNLGVWVLIGTMLAAWSRSPGAAAAHVLAFFAGMLGSYYFYSMMLFGAFPKSLFLAWGGIALLSPVGAYIAWYGRGRGWIAALIAALPVGLLLAEGFPVFYTGSMARGFDILAACALIVLLGKPWSQRARILAMALVVLAVLRETHLLSLILGTVMRRI